MDYRALGREYKAAVKGREVGRFLGDIDEALAAKQLRPNQFSIRRLFEALVEDGSEMVSTWGPREQGSSSRVSLMEADAHTPAHLLEAGATLSSAFSHITGQLVITTVMQAYTDEAFVFTPLVNNVPTQFNGERIPGITRLGDTFESIGEAEPYPIAGVGEDWVDTPQTVKRGEIVPFTRESIYFDRTNLLLSRAGEAGYFYGVNKEKRIIDAVIDENVTTHRYKWKDAVYATFQGTTPWINLQGSNALVDWTDVETSVP